MDVFKEYAHIFLTTVLLISSFSTFAVAVCTLPTELHNTVWNYQYTDLSNNTQTTTLTFGRTTLTKPSNIRLNALGTILNAWTCISNLTLSSDVSVAVFKSDASYSDVNGIRKWVYLCMKLTKVADDFFYFYLLSDEDGSVYPEERVYQSGSIPDNTVPVCSTFCQYTTQPRIRTLKKSGSSATLPGDVSLCEPCDSACEEDATCSLPQDLINTAWEYNYTNVKDNTEQSTTLNFATTTLQSSAISLDAKGTTIDDWTCINSLGISDTEAVVVFKSDNSFSDGPFAGSQWLYLCMKLTKVTTDLYYFYLLSDTFTGVTPDERVFASEEGNPPNNNDPVCSTFCQYTESPNIRTLQKPGTHDALPNDASLCEPCSSSCKVATTEMTSTQKTTIPSTSTEIDTTIELTSIETTPITSQPTTSTEIDIITTIQSTDLTQITSQPTTSNEVNTIATIHSTETTQITSQPTTSTEVNTIKTIQSTETTQITTQPTTSTEVNTITTIRSTETTYIPTMRSTSTETVTTADMTSTNANKETTRPNTTIELGTTTEEESPTTSLEVTPPPTSNEMDTSTETTTKETTQTTAVHSTVVDSETTQITTTQFTTKDTETTTELKISTTDLKVEMTLETLVTDTELLKRYSGPIIVGGLAIFGFVLVIIIFVLLKVRSMIGKERISNNKDHELCGVIPETCYIYKGKDCGFQKIAVQHWDSH